MAGLSQTAFAPHDLVWLDEPARALSHAMAGAPAGASLPAWVSLQDLLATPVVVRRAERPDGDIPVGLRGHARAERFGTWVAPASIRKIVTPADLAARHAWRVRPELAGLPAIQALESISILLDASGMQWGVTGGVGFSLACARNVLHAGSDLDLVIHAPQPLSSVQFGLLDALHREASASASAGIDIQVATPFGAFALLERLRSGGRVLLKTDRGPRMCVDPWQAAP